MILSLGAVSLTDGEPTGRTLLPSSQLETVDTVNIAGTETTRTWILNIESNCGNFSDFIRLTSRSFVAVRRESSQLVKVSVND